MDKNVSTIGQRLQALRNAKNLRTSDVQELTGISVGNLSSMENDKTCPSSKALLKLSALYGVSTDWILKGDDCRCSAEDQGLDLRLHVPDLELAAYFTKISEIWLNGDARTKTWVMVQLERAFPEVKLK